MRVKHRISFLIKLLPIRLQNTNLLLLRPIFIVSHYQKFNLLKIKNVLVFKRCLPIFAIRVSRNGDVVISAVLLLKIIHKFQRDDIHIFLQFQVMLKCKVMEVAFIDFSVKVF